MRESLDPGMGERSWSPDIRQCLKGGKIGRQNKGIFDEFFLWIAAGVEMRNGNLGFTERKQNVKWECHDEALIIML